ncbi:DUF6057 family protein [Bacteroides sp. UBA939]|uniref:DUF6057 family protein n=1 Tax=Bacteroides sp. UBA939 TaxID=1946092 RepID=UPI0025B87A35|nr:DUF6057 family protein [Bacteroides sp. UBA939]
MDTPKAITMKTLRNFLFPVCFLAGCCAFFTFCYPYHLHFREQTTLFTGFDIAQYLQKPAWISEMFGDYLTQFFLLRGGGGLIIACVLFLLWAGFYSSFRKMKLHNAGCIAWLPVAAEWVLSCYLEYPLSMVIGAVVSVWTFRILSEIRNQIVFRFCCIVFAIILYISVGVHFLLFILLSVIYDFKRNKSWLFPLLLLVLSFLTMYIAGHFFYLTTKQACFYPIIEGYLLSKPFVYLITEATLLIAIFLGQIEIKQCVLYILTVCGLVSGICVTSNWKEEYDLGFMCEAYYGRWDKVLEMSRQQKYKSYLSAYYANLVNARRGQLPDSLLYRYQPAHYGLLIEVKETVPYSYVMASIDALMLCGDLEHAQHSAMLGMVFTPHQRSSRMVRRMAEISMLNRDKQAAEKFLYLLSKTTFHRRWSIRQQQLMANGHPATIADSLCIADNDVLFSPNDIRTSITNLLKTCPGNKNAVDYLLCYHLLRKDLKSFKIDYDAYYFPFFGNNPPAVYQEALLMCINEGVLYYHIPQSKNEEKEEYLAFFENNKENVEAMRENFGSTYWFYHFYARLK